MSDRRGHRQYARRRPGRPSVGAVAPLRPEPRHRAHRAVPRVVRSDPQRPPRDHRDGVAALRPGDRGGDAEPAEGGPPVLARRAPADDRGDGGPPRQRRGDDVLEPRGRPGDGDGGRLHHQGPPGGLRLRVRAPDGADEPQDLRGVDRVHPLGRPTTRSWPRSSSARSPDSAATSARWCRHRCRSGSRRSTRS